MTTLVTGAGMIGAETAKLLADRGDAVVLLDLNPSASAIDTVVGKGRYVLEAGDVTDDALVDDIIRRHRITDVVHTAAILTKRAIQAPKLAFDINFGSTVSFLDRQRVGMIRRTVIATSTTTTFPLFSGPTITPIPEDYSYRVLSQCPDSIYAMTKLCSEMALLSYRNQFKLNAIALRFSAVIGVSPTGSIGVPSRFLKCLLDAGRQGVAAVYDDPMLVWEGGDEFVDVRDAARAILMALDAKAPEQGVYHITGQDLLTMEHFIDGVREFYPALTVRFDTEIAGPICGLANPRPGPSDTAAASRELGFKATYKIRDTIAYITELFERTASHAA